MIRSSKIQPRILIKSALAVAIVFGMIGSSSTANAMSRPRVGEPGLSYVTYNYPDLDPATWDGVKPWLRGDGRTNCGSGVIAQVDYSWGGGSVLGCQVDDVAIGLTGLITVPRTGVYTFLNRSDDGFILKINQRTVIHNWKSQGPANFNDSGRVTLIANAPYRIEIWYFEDGGGADLSLSYAYRRSSPQLVPSEWLSHR